MKIENVKGVSVTIDHFTVHVPKTGSPKVYAKATYYRPDTGERVVVTGPTDREAMARAKMHMLRTWLKLRLGDDDS